MGRAPHLQGSQELRSQPRGHAASITRLNILMLYFFQQLAGTIRFFTGEVRQRVEELIRRIAAGVGMAYGCEIEPTWDAGYPPTVNDAALASQAAKAAQRAGLEVLADEPASMAAEDFAFFGQQTPAVYMRLGATPAGENGADLHTDGYDFNDELIAPGVALLVGIVLETWHD